jgi:hypothetical protein
VVFPAAGLVVAGGGAEHTGSFFVRVYETASLHLHERAANSFLRAQAVVDTVTAGKMAAVAASAAAVAGDGFAVEGVLSASPATPQAIVRRADHGLATAFVKAPAKTSTHAKHRSHAHASNPHHDQKGPEARVPTTCGNLACHRHPAVRRRPGPVGAIGQLVRASLTSFGSRCPIGARMFPGLTRLRRLQLPAATRAFK